MGMKAGQHHPTKSLSYLGPAALVAAFGVGCGSDSDTVELTVSNHNPEGTPTWEALQAWADHVAEQSGGKLKLTMHHGGELLTGDDAYEGVQTGAADVAIYVLDQAQGFRLNTVVTLPFMGWAGQQETTEIYQDLLEDYSELQDEWKGVEPIAVYMMPGTHLHNTTKEIRTPEDIDGMKTMGAEGMLTESVEAAGAIPVAIDVAEMAPALDDGKVEAVINHFPVLDVFGALEKLTYHTIFGSGGINMTPMTLIINNDVMDNLPSDVQKVLRDSGSVFSDTFFTIDEGYSQSCIDRAKEWGHTFTELSDEELAVWYDLVKKSVHNKWIAAAEAKGLPAQPLYDDVLERIEEAK